MKLDGCAALITGASAGIGREFARCLAPQARQLVLVARRQERLDELRRELIATHPKLQVEVRVVNLASTDEVNALAEWLSGDGTNIDLLINNAGLGDIGNFVTAERQRLEEILLVNIHALTLLCRAALPAMLARNRGAILNVSSSAGFLPIAGFAVYAASKAYVTSLTEALRAEVRGSGVTVSALCPGPVHTEFTDVAHRAETRQPPSPELVHVSAQTVARAGLRAIERDRPLVIPGAVMKLAMFLTRLTPMPILRLMSQISAKRV
jgi:uncharacterized protein